MSEKKNDLGRRMKGYEGVSRFYLTRRMPVIIRIDGKAFHSFTKGFERPFDDVLIESMQETAKYLCRNITGCKLAYTQSDEISLLLEDYDNIATQSWFDNNLQKLVSVSASMATMEFNRCFANNVAKYFEKNNTEEHHELITAYSLKVGTAMFDSRAFVLPRDEVCNYFIWRQQDASRNSIQMVAQTFFTHKQLQGKNCNQLQEMLFSEHHINWNNYPTVYKRGSCIVKSLDSKKDEVLEDLGTVKVIFRPKWVVDKEIPVFTKDRQYIESLVFLNE